MKIRRFKHINEDTPQQPVQQAAPANNQQQQPQQGLTAPQIDYNTCVSNVNKFIGNLYKNIQDTIKNNMEKSCPEALALTKDQNSPVKDQAKQLTDAYSNFTKVAINPDDAKTTASAIEEFAKFISALTTFNTQVTQQAANQPVPADNLQLANTQLQPAQQQNAAPANNALQPATPADAQLQPAQNVTPLNASYDTSNFGKMLSEKLNMKRYEKSIKSIF